jgi:hypothetical protein
MPEEGEFKNEGISVYLPVPMVCKHAGGGEVMVTTMMYESNHSLCRAIACGYLADSRKPVCNRPESRMTNDGKGTIKAEPQGTKQCPHGDVNAAFFFKE